MYSEQAAEYQDSVIENDGFFPDIDCGDFEKTRDIPPRISHSTIRNALLSSVVMINLRLEKFQRRSVAKGYKSMSQIPGVKIKLPAASDDEAVRTTAPEMPLNASEALYIRAVYALAKADLMAEGTANGIKDNRPGVDGDGMRRSLLTESAQAVRALTGVPRASVTLVD